MVNHLIYEKPNLTLWERIKSLWDYEIIYPRGFLPQYLNKKREETDGERIQERFKQAGTDEETPVKRQGPEIPSSSKD